MAAALAASGSALADDTAGDHAAGDHATDIELNLDALYMQPGGTLSTGPDRIGLDRALGLEAEPGLAAGVRVVPAWDVPLEFELNYAGLRFDEQRLADRSFSLVGVDVTSGASTIDSDWQLDQLDLLGVFRLAEVMPAVEALGIDLRAGLGLRLLDARYELRERGSAASPQSGFAELTSEDAVAHVSAAYWPALDVELGVSLTGTPASGREMLDAAAWAGYRVAESTQIRLGYRYLGHEFDDEANVDYAVEAYGAQLGLSYVWGTTLGVMRADTDDDGVPDADDRCPKTSPGAAVDDFGCEPDADGDGVADAADECPGTPAGVVVDDAGCVMDSDADGVPDGQDQCPDTQPGQAVERDGCPFDADGDGVLDPVDECPDTPAGVVVDANGCGADFDGDGVVNGVDRCANTPSGTPVGPDGCETQPLPDSIASCSDTGAEALACATVGDEITVPDIRFASGSARLDLEAQESTDTLARVMRAQPALVIEIQGHTDAQGDEDANQRLSELRARSVMNAIIRQGISPGRLIANGYGELRPVASNDTAEGRAKNRRVVIRVTER